MGDAEEGRMSEGLFVALLSRKLCDGEPLLDVINSIPASVPLQTVKISVPWWEMMVERGADLFWDEGTPSRSGVRLGTITGWDKESLLSVINRLPDRIALQDVRISIPWQVQAEGDEITLEYDYHAGREELEQLGAKGIRHATGEDAYGRAV
jgi:hypothetical protein